MPPKRKPLNPLSKPVSSEPIQTRIGAIVRQSILAGELRPGEPVSELHLSRQHGVSQAVVREALAKLEHAGLVRRIHNIGTFVREMSPREIQQRVRLRVMLEGLAGMEAARLAKPRQHEELDRNLKAIAGAVSANDYFASEQADLEFHRTIWRCSGDEVLYQILDELTVPLFAFVSMERRRRQENLSDVLQAHEPIARAIQAQDAGAAREALAVHIGTSYAEFRGSEQGYTLSIQTS